MEKINRLDTALCLLPEKYNPLKWILALWASLVAYSRIYNGVHYPLDVIVAALMDTLLGYAAFRAYNYWTLSKNKILYKR